MYAVPHAPGPAQTDRLLAFNQQLIEQALALVAAHGAGSRRCFAGPAGAHLRHVIEHYEALVFPAAPGVVDYDNRPRDRELESSPTLAGTRLQALHDHLGAWPPQLLDAAVQVHGQGGIAGGFNFTVTSCIGRELAFLASHTVHHFALLAPYCRQHAIQTPADFGQAPSTVAHANAACATPAAHTFQESSCPAPSLPARPGAQH
jgi:hypothetical protein